MTQTIEWKMTADERELVAAWLAGKNSIEAYNASLGKLDGAQAKNAQSAAQQNRAMSDLQSLLKKSETAQESYNRRVKNFRELLDAGRVSQESYSRAVGQARQELDKSKGASSDFSSSILGSIGPIVSGYASIGAAVGLVTQGIRFAIDANRQFNAETQEAGKKFDKSSRSFAIQAGLNDEERAAAEKRFVAIGSQTGFSREKVGSAADALASAGFATGEASGGSLRAVLQTLNAQGLREADAGGIAESLAKFLDASGLQKTQANVESVANQFQAFADTNLRLRDLPAIAAIGGTLAGKVDPRQQIAAAGVLSRTTDVSQAATGLQNIVLNLGTASGQKDRVESLAELGLKPEQVDFRGEGLTDVLKTLDAALSQKSLPDQDRILKKLVEGANISIFESLRKNVGEIETRAQTSEVEGAKLFAPAERLGSQSRDAIETRLNLQTESLLASQDQRGDLYRKAIELQSIQAGESAPFREGRRRVFDLGAALTDPTEATFKQSLVSRAPAALFEIAQNPLKAFSATREALIGASLDTAATAQAAATGRVSEVDPQMAEQNRLLQQLVNNTDPARGNKPNTAPPKTPAAKGRESVRP